MGVKHWVRAMLVLAALPATAAALGLGEIRLNSPLNAPLDAEIELVNATAEELAGLRAELASRETFARYGLEWPAFLSSITLSRAKSANGKDVLRVRSSEAITEPFVTLLVDANWGRGRLVREYTLLLDPPTFSPAQAAVAPVQAAVTPAARPAAVERPASTPVAPEPAEARAPSGAAESITDRLTVRRGDTLSGIAARAVVQPDVSLEQAMVGLYRANPRAFDGTMSDLRAGSVLRLPESADMTSISREAAVAEVRRQGVEWRNRGAETSATDDGAGRLRLVPPTETTPGTAAASGAAAGDPAEMKALRDRLGSLERDLTESRRQLELRSAEIAALQARLAGTGTAVVPATPPPAAAAPPAPMAAPIAEPGVAATEVAPVPEVAAPAVEAPPVAATPAPARPRPATPAVEEPEPVSMLDSVIGLVTRFWWAAAGLLVLLAGLFGFRRWQQRREVEPELSDIILPTPPDLTPLPAMAAEAAVPTTSETSRLRRPNIAAPEETAGFLVEESGEYERPVAQPEPAAPMVSLDEETLSGDTNLNLDQGDPLAEADFHMAYGLYDQAADLVKLAAGREPKRRDLKLKLAEVYFVWGNRDEFLNAARQLHETRAAGVPGEWDKVVIMGRQIAPDDPLFAGVAVSGTGSDVDSALDLPLGEGDQPLDFDFVSDGGAATQLLDTAEVGEDLANPESDSPTEIFDLSEDDGEGGVSLRFTDSPTMESSRLDLDLDLGEGDELSEAPTVEQPGLSAAGGFALRQKLDAALREGEASVEQTAELAIDDLGLDLGDLDKLDGDDDGADVIDLSERRNERAQQQSAAALLAREAEQDASATALIEVPEAQRLEPDFDLSAFETSEVLESGEPDTDAAATLIEPLQDLGSGLGRDLASDEVYDFDLNLDDVLSPAASMTAESMTAESDLAELEDLTAKFESGAVGRQSDFGAPAESTRADESSIEPQVVLDSADDELLLNAFEPATISEVGTKLDLARAYIDMGDPDGARSILLEVLQEGSVTQKQEAQRLVEALPG
jgi:pilus assembly protein FimV